MFTLNDKKSALLLKPRLRLDLTLYDLKHLSRIQLLRLRGKFVDSRSELDTIQAELNRRQRWEYLAYAILIAGAIILLSVLI